MTRNQVARPVGNNNTHPKQSQSGDEAPGEAHPLSKPATEPQLSLRLLTHNIRYATNYPFKGEELWPVRCPRLCSELVFNSIVPETFICLQEVLHSQLLDISKCLNASPSIGGGWAYIGVGRDDGEESGEYSPIFYRPLVWNLERWKTTWLSETPRVPSKGWDAASVRIATIGFFRHFQTGKRVIVTSTHFDDQGKISRKESAQLLENLLQAEWELSGYDASFLAGDFNSNPEGEAYQLLTSPESCMVDVCDLVPKEKRYGNDITFTGFSDESKPDRIDFIFALKSEIGTRINAAAYGVLPNLFDDGVYSSDHRAVVADFHFISK
jgi:endonuclease/exonuclease/phosphatase family metal-dependent hydrolase